jgi:hypothetical protein
MLGVTFVFRGVSCGAYAQGKTILSYQAARQVLRRKVRYFNASRFYCQRGTWPGADNNALFYPLDLRFAGAAGMEIKIKLRSRFEIPKVTPRLKPYA